MGISGNFTMLWFHNAHFVPVAGSVRNGLAGGYGAMGVWPIRNSFAEVWAWLECHAFLLLDHESATQLKINRGCLCQS